MPGDVFSTHAAVAVKRNWINDDCAGTFLIEDRDDTFAYVICDQCGLEVAVPIREFDPAIQIARLLTTAELPSRFVATSWMSSADTAPVVAALREWAAREKLTPTPVLWGRPGRGKTLMLVTVARELIRRRRIRAWFVTAPDLLSRMQAAIGTPAYEQAWRHAVGVDLLLLDDLGAEMDTDWRADRIAALVDERYRADRPLMATTNVSPARWSDAFDARTVSRLNEMSMPVELVGVDRRIPTEATACARLGLIPNPNAPERSINQ